MGLAKYGSWLLELGVAVVVTLGVTLGVSLQSAGSAPEIPRSPAPADAQLYIISPADRAVVKSPVTVRFGLRGMGVAPAGVARPGTGHHHLLIDTELPPLGEPVPADERHLHFGGGQTETTIQMKPGVHTLQLVLGDQNHVPHDPPVVSDRITITVE